MPQLTDKDIKDLELGKKIREFDDTHRTVYYDEVCNQYLKGRCFGSSKDILDFLDKPQYAAIKGRYLRTQSIKSYQDIVTSIPIPLVLDTYNTLVRPIYTDFTETTENLEFLEFSGFFYHQLFTHETIYVSYNFFERENYILPPPGTTPGHKEIKKKIEALKEKGGFDAGVKLTEDELDGNIEFMHITTSLVVKVPKGREKLIRVKGGAVYLGNFASGFNLTITYLVLLNLLESFLKLSVKRVLISTAGKSESVVDKLQGMLETVETQIHLDLQDSTLIKEKGFVDGILLKEVRNTVYHYIDRLMAEYGRVANTNPKGERMTTMEQYKDISSIANRQKETLENLIYFAMKAKELGNIDLEFAVSGIPEKEALHTVAHRAQTPNMEKEYFGQVHGTQPRVPYGQKTPQGQKAPKPK